MNPNYHEDIRTRLVTPEQLSEGYVVRLFTANPWEVKTMRLDYRILSKTPEGNYIVADPEEPPCPT